MKNSPKCGPDLRVESKFPKPDDSQTDDAIEYLKKSFHKLPHAGTAKAKFVIADAVKDGIQRNAVEWALVRMQEYGWIKLSIPVWGGVIGKHRSEPKYQAPVRTAMPTRSYFGTQEYTLRLTKYFYNPSYCVTCKKLIGDFDYDRSECHDCRSTQGKLADLEVAIKCQQLYGNDDPERIHEWPTIRAYLRDRFGPERTNMQLWEWMKDHLRVLGWDQERWLRMKYGEFIDLLKSGLLNERQPENKGGSVGQSSAMGSAKTPKSERCAEADADLSENHNETPPPKYDPNSTDWILSETLCRLFNIKASSISEYRKPRHCGDDKHDEFGRWNRDCIGTFRRKVNKKASVAYFRPYMTDAYKAKLTYAESHSLQKT